MLATKQSMFAAAAELSDGGDEDDDLDFPDNQLGLEEGQAPANTAAAAPPASDEAQATIPNERNTKDKKEAIKKNKADRRKQAALGKYMCGRSNTSNC